MSPEQYDRVVAAVQEARSKGWTVEAEGWGIFFDAYLERWVLEEPSHPRVCPLGALMLSDGGCVDDEQGRAAARLLRTNDRDIDAFIQGVDGGPTTSTLHGPWFDAGRRMRSELGL